eukprot:7379277-Prymnesium_polylepis.1
MEQQHRRRDRKRPQSDLGTVRYRVVWARPISPPKRMVAVRLSRTCGRTPALQPAQQSGRAPQLRERSARTTRKMPRPPLHSTANVAHHAGAVPSDGACRVQLLKHAPLATFAVDFEHVDPAADSGGASQDVERVKWVSFEVLAGRRRAQTSPPEAN